jgi:putative ABC transport system substrate-binding protein
MMDSMTTRRVLALGGLSLAILSGPISADAQPAGKIPRIGILRLGSAPDPLVESLRQGLRDLGYVEGQNVGIEYRWVEGRDERLPDLASDLVRIGVDVIVAGGTQALVARRHTTTIPIVMPVAADPVGPVSLRASPGRVGTSPDSRSSARSCRVSGWSS